MFKLVAREDTGGRPWLTALEPSGGGENGGCARGPNTSDCPSRWLRQKRCTTHFQRDRRLPGPRRRWSSASCMTVYGHRSDLHRGSGWASLRSPGRSGATAARGAPQGTACRPSPCPLWQGQQEKLWTPPRCASSLLRRCGTSRCSGPRS